MDFDICWTQNRKNLKSIKEVEALDAVSFRRRRRRLCLLALRYSWSQISVSLFPDLTFANLIINFVLLFSRLIRLDLFDPDPIIEFLGLGWSIWGGIDKILWWNLHLNMWMNARCFGCCMNNQSLRLIMLFRVDWTVFLIDLCYSDCFFELHISVCVCVCHWIGFIATGSIRLPFEWVVFFWGHGASFRLAKLLQSSAFLIPRSARLAVSCSFWFPCGLFR